MLKVALLNKKSKLLVNHSSLMTVTLRGTSGSKEVETLHYHIILQITEGQKQEAA